MPDISMCKNKLCPLSNRCYRYTAIPHPFRQSYAEFSDINCNYFIDVRDYIDFPSIVWKVDHLGKQVEDEEIELPRG